MNNPNILISIGIALIMFGIGLNISFKSFKKIFIRPKSIITGLTCQMLILPAVAFLIAWCWPMQGAYKAGLVLVAACPGGTASNLVTHMLKGRVALSVSLTSFNSFLILLSIPFIVNLATSTFLGEAYNFHLSMASTALDIGTTVLIPVLVGMVVHQFIPELTDRLKKSLRYILPGILLGMFLIILLSSSGNSSIALNDGLALLLPALLLNISTMFAGFYISRKVGIKKDGQFTIAIEMGLQNSALAIFIANALVQNNEIAFVAIVYSSFSFFTTWALAYALKRFG
ncbi:bile acid:sodium symporter family protein [Fulvivirga sp.]|uniref:bile acid:sodium symporter family protein n=1 Tax=Fulvivirga sp. TaxID=1931237 RepID=UPI0032ECCD6C